MRNMSFWLTLEQMKAEKKDVTRRFGWWFLKRGDVVMAVERAVGLGRNGKVRQLYPIKIVSIRAERLDAITEADCVREGFPDLSPQGFVEMICKHYNCLSSKIINRIEFKRVL